MYHEFAPSRTLSGVVRCEWERGDGSEDGEILVLPDGCVDLVWRSDGLLFVAGPDLGPVIHPHPFRTGFVGLRLEPGAAATVLGVGVDELRDRQIPLTALWGSPAESLADGLDATGSGEAGRELLARAVRDRIVDVTLDNRVLAAARALESERAQVSHVAARVGLSERQLYRRFVRQVGYGPKTFARVMRFRRFVTLSQTGMHRGGLAALAAAAGYADQAHLTRECRRLAARTPVELLTAA